MRKAPRARESGPTLEDVVEWYYSQGQANHSLDYRYKWIADLHTFPTRGGESGQRLEGDES